MDNHIDEELQIMSEREKKSDKKYRGIFKSPIQELCKRSVKTLDISATLKDAVDLLQRFKIGAVVITDNGKLAGILTERDILMKVLGKVENYAELPVTEVMTKNPSWLMTADKMAFVMNKMRVGGYRHVPIVDDEMVPLHMISLKDVLGFLLDHFPEEILNLPADPYREKIDREGA